MLCLNGCRRGFWCGRVECRSYRSQNIHSLPAPGTPPSHALSPLQTRPALMRCLTVLPEWPTAMQTLADQLRLKKPLLRAYFERLGGRVFRPITGGGHTSDAVLNWMNECFMSKTTTGSLRPCLHAPFSGLFCVLCSLAQPSPLVGSGLCMTIAFWYAVCLCNACHGGA